MKRFLTLGFLGVFFLCVSSMVFAHSSQMKYVENPSIGNLTSNQRILLGHIERSGVHIIKQGMYFTFILPTDCFFEKDTRNLYRDRYNVLYELAQFLQGYANYFKHPTIYVNGFTDKVWLYPARMKLSAHYAKIIASQLKFAGLSGISMKVRGYGAKKPVASNEYPDGTAYNRRVVVMIR